MDFCRPDLMLELFTGASVRNIDRTSTFRSMPPWRGYLGGFDTKAGSELASPTRFRNLNNRAAK